MHYFYIDYSIISFFLLITCIVGILAGRNTKTLQDYALANRTYRTTALVLTYLATDIGGGSILSDAASVFERGIIVYVSITSLVIAYITRAIFIAPKMTYFTSCLTMGEIIGNLYGNFARILTGTLAFLNANILAGIQLTSLGIMCESLLGINATYGIIIGGVLILFYSVWGGIKSITSTDVFQFFVLIAFIPFITIIAVKQVGGWNELFVKLPSKKLDIIDHEQFYKYLTYFFIWLFQLGMIDPAVIQRMLMANSKYSLRKKYFIIACFNPLFRFMVMLIGLAGCILYPTIASIDIVPCIIKILLPVGLKGLVISGLLAVVMSSADSCIHVAGLTFIHDIVHILFKQRINVFNELNWVKCATICTGLFAIIIGMAITNISYWGFKVLELTGPILMFPFIAGICGLKPEKKSFFIALVCTLVSFIISNILIAEKYNRLATLISTVTNGISFFGSHYWINKRFKIVYRKIDKYLSEYTPMKSFLSCLLPKNLFIYIQNQIEEIPYVVSGIFCLSNLLIPHLLCNKIIQSYPTFLFCIDLIGIILCILLIVKDKLSQSFQHKYLPGLFYCTLLYCLPFISICMYMLSYGDIVWQSNIFVSLTLLIVLVDWGMFILLIVVGIVLNLLFYLYFGPINWLWNTSYTCFMVYQILLVLFVGIFFTRRKGKYMHRIKQEKQQLTLYHRLRETDYLYNLQYQAFHRKQIELQKNPLSTIKKALSILSERYPKEAPLAQKGLGQLDAFFTYYKSSFYHTMDAMRLQVRYISLDHLLGQISLFLNNPSLSNRVCIRIQTHRDGLTCDVKR